MRFSCHVVFTALVARMVAATMEGDVAVPSFLRTKGKKPVLTDGGHVIKHNGSEDLTEIAAKVPSNLGAMDPKERAELLGSLAEKMQAQMEQLEEYDLSDFPALVKAVEAARVAVDGAMKPMSDSMSFIKTAGEQQHHQQQHVAVEAGEEKDKALAQKQKRRRAQEANAKDKADEENDQEENDDDEEQGHHWKHYYHEAKHKFSRHHQSSHRHKHGEDIQQAILNGDHAFLNRMVNNVHARASTHFGSAGRRRAAEEDEAQEHRDLQTDKATNCEQLAKCAVKMSLYDVFVYFFSDDINPNTGEVDDSVTGYDEMKGDYVLKEAGEGNPADPRPNKYVPGVQLKLDKIHDAARKLLPGGNFRYDSGDCDSLLQLFHRSIEVAGNPEWEGAFVAQVCFAEGTQVFVDLNQILKALVAKIPPPDDIFNALFYTFDAMYLVEPFAFEILTCAKDLFDALENVHNEPFPFAGIFKNPQKLSEFAFPNATNSDPKVRDVHGRIKDLSQPAFKSQEYGEIAAEFSTCGAKYVKEWSDACELKTKMESKDVKKYMDCLEEKTELEVDEEDCTDTLTCLGATLQSAINKCLPTYATKIQNGIELVFGEGASTGFICGLKEGIKDGMEMPGDCCLNAPFQLKGDAWGFEYSCRDKDSEENKCIHGPVLSGISEEACHVYGGTFCPTPDCTVLRTCVEQEIQYADRTELNTYKNYLQNSPQIAEDKVRDQFACGRAREYFGYQPNFIDDSAICDDMKQLRYSDDFEFLNEFFNQGSKGVNAGSSECASGKSTDKAVDCVPTIGLSEPSRAVSGVAPPTNGQIWRATNFALGKAVDVIFFILETSDSVKCPCDPACVSDNVCAGVKTIVETPLTIIKFILEVALDISDFTMGELAEVGNIEPIETWEDSTAVFPNMEAMGGWLEARMKYLYYETTCRSVDHLQPGHGCDGKVQLCDNKEQERVPDTCKEDVYHPVIDFDRVNRLCSPGKFVFTSVEEAIQCVKMHVIATDDCYEATVEVAHAYAGLQTSTCGSVETIQVTATEEQACHKKTTKFFDVLVDSEAFRDVNVDSEAVGFCKFTHDPNVPPELDLTEAIEECSEKFFFPTIEDALGCVEHHTSASDDCRAVDITVRDKSNLPITEPKECGTQEHVVEVTANIRGCSLQTVKTMHVFVDPMKYPVEGGIEEMSDKEQYMKQHQRMHKDIEESKNYYYYEMKRSCEFTQGPRLDPILDVTQAIELCNEQIFPTITEAEACVLGNTVATDASGSCRPVPLTVDTINVNGLCEHQVTITANIQGCMPLETVSVPINVTIDNEPPVPSCDFLLEESFFEKLKSSKHEMHDWDYLNPQLIYSASENCGTPITVTIDGYSNENDDHDKETMLIQYEEPVQETDGKTTNTKMGWYVANEVCYHPKEHKLEKQDCIHDPGTPWTRIYMAKITAQDEAGLKASSQCFFEIYEPPSKSFNGRTRRLKKEAKPKKPKKGEEEEEAVEEETGGGIDIKQDVIDTGKQQNDAVVDVVDTGNKQTDLKQGIVDDTSHLQDRFSDNRFEGLTGENPTQYFSLSTYTYEKYIPDKQIREG